MTGQAAYRTILHCASSVMPILQNMCVVALCSNVVDLFQNYWRWVCWNCVGAYYIYIYMSLMVMAVSSEIVNALY